MEVLDVAKGVVEDLEIYIRDDFEIYKWLTIDFTTQYILPPSE